MSDTKQKLIKTAIELFGKYGFEGTTTRMLAENAGVNIAAIPYHFDSKRGLYHAVFDHILDHIANAVGLDMRKAKHALDDKADFSKSEALDHLRNIFSSMAELFVGSKKPSAWPQLILREQVSPTDVFDHLYEQQMAPLHRVLDHLIGICLNRPPDDMIVKLKGQLLIAQLLVFPIRNEVIIRHLGVEELDNKLRQQAHRLILDHCDACLQIHLAGDERPVDHD